MKDLDEMSVVLKLYKQLLTSSLLQFLWQTSTTPAPPFSLDD